MNNNKYVILRANQALTNNSTKQLAHNLVKGSVSNGYFEQAWESRNKSGNYSIWNLSSKTTPFAGFAFVDKRGARWRINLIGARKGQGVGKRLLSAIKNNAKAQKAHFIRLNSVSNAVGFYKKQNFKTTRKTTNSTYMSYNVLKNRLRTFLPRSVKKPVKLSFMYPR